jgi:hypothetical protein
MNKRADAFIVILTSFVIIIFIAFAIISFSTKNPHWLNRGGALIAAIGAIAIIFQIQYEIALEKEMKKIEPDDSLSKHEDFESPIDRTAFILRLNDMHRKSKALTNERLRISAVVVICALSGELLHGFGDLFLLNFFSNHFIH